MNRSDSAMRRVAPQTITELIEKLFCSPRTARYGPYRLLDEGTEVLQSTLYQYEVEDPSGIHRSLQMFRGLGQVGGQLWEQEARVLLRLNAIGHPALPRITDGAYDEEHDIAFVTTEHSDYSLAVPEALPYLRQRPAACVRHLALLADALALLHGQGLMHRNLWPGTIDVVQEDPDDVETIRLRLSRFEMSTLLGNFLRRVLPDVERIDDEVRHFFLDQGQRALAYCPPERLAFLFPDASADAFETDRSDVYGLGVMAWEWFVGALPEEILTESPASATAPPSWTRTFHARMMAEITQHNIPARLRDLLRGMLDPDPRTRFTSSQVVDIIARNYDALIARWETPTSEPYLVAFMPDQSGATVFKWGWIGHDPAYDTGRLELTQLLERDLRGAALLYSPDGAKHYVSGGEPEAKRAARYVIAGKQGIWFCQPYDHWGRFGAASRRINEILLIKYVARRDSLQTHKLEGTLFQRRLPRVEVVVWPLTEAQLTERQQRHPSWAPVLGAVMTSDAPPEWLSTYEDAFDWLLDEQEVELIARTYPFVRMEEGVGVQWVRLRYDRERDLDRINRRRSSLFALFASRPALRPAFADFFDSLEDNGAPAELEIYPDENGRPARDGIGSIYLTRTLDRESIEVRVLTTGLVVPNKGWIRPKQDRGTEVALTRQRRVRPEFLESRALLSQFHKPSTIKGPRQRWRDAGRDLRGGAASIVKDMLGSQTFYALHGPPGTGKTTVAAHAVTAYLGEERGARILVSAQSNYALDNLAVRIRRQLEAEGLDVLAVRIPSTQAEVDPQIQDWELGPLVAEQKRRIVQATKQRLERRSDPLWIRELLEQWLAAVDTGDLELLDRVRRGANIVFATCTSSTRRNVDTGGFGVYDWVIVEEAAKAWPTELAIPLVRGVRWTLIGDHHQLPAYRSREIEQVLEAWASAEDKELNRNEYGKVFRLFAHLFDNQGDISQSTSTEPKKLDSPLGRLTVQFRMRRPIAEVVSRAFYPQPGGPDASGAPRGMLTTDPSTEVDSGIVEPEALRGQSLVWLDTRSVADCVQRPRWSNEGEVDLVSRLLHQLRPSPRSLLERASGRDIPLAILTPYLEQKRALERAPLPAGCQPLIHTVDAFQGREADIVVVSLVRDTVTGNTPQRNLGHLADPERVNVLFSRARRLLIIVGRFDHFAQSGVPFWHTVCDTVSTEGMVIGAEHVIET